MHFFYLDESGDTGDNLHDPEQPILVLGGLSVRDQGWRETLEEFREIMTSFLGTEPDPGFELHADEVLSPMGEGPFAGRSRDDRNTLALDVLNLLVTRKHGVHYAAVDKSKLDVAVCDLDLDFDPKSPYLVAFDVLVSLINHHVKEHLGATSRGLIVLDEKTQHHGAIERIMWGRRFSGPKVHRVKWVTEAGYPVDSRKNVMIQASDLVTYCTKRFLEVEHGYRDALPKEAKNFYAECYSLIDGQRRIKSFVSRTEPKLAPLNDFCEAICVGPRQKWKSRYGLT
jgi:hypothetical protein